MRVCVCVRARLLVVAVGENALEEIIANRDYDI